MLSSESQRFEDVIQKLEAARRELETTHGYMKSISARLKLLKTSLKKKRTV